MEIPIIAVMRALAKYQRVAQIADYLNISPACVQTALSQLRDSYGIAVEQNECWWLTFTPQWLDSEFLSSQLPLAVTIMEETAATNQQAKQAKDNSIIYAEYQTAGYGRYRRPWRAIPGGSIMMSARLTAPSRLTGLSLAIGAALWRAFGMTLRLKWPNDLLNNKGEKVAGILIETKAQNVIVGVGINLIMTPQLCAYLGRSAAALPLSLSRNVYAALTANTIINTVADFSRYGLAAFLPDVLKAHYVAVGDNILFINDSSEDNKPMKGKFVGFGDEGELLIARDGDVYRYFTGELYVAGG